MSATKSISSVESRQAFPLFLSIQKGLLGIGIFLIFLTGLTWGIRTAFKNSTLGVDFYIYWDAAKQFAASGDPYSLEVAQDTQLAYYGRPAADGEDVKAFAYPLFTLIPLLPFAWFDIQTAISLYMALNILAMLTLAYFFGEPHPRWLDFSLIFFYPLSFGILVGNVSLLIGLVILAVLGWVIFNQTPSIAVQIFLGLGLAWCSGKPQFSWAILAAILVIAVLRRLWPFTLSLIAGIPGWAGLSFLLFPGWLSEWIGRLFAYSQYGHTKLVLSTYLGVFFTQTMANTLAWLVAILFFLISIAAGVQWYRKLTLAQTHSDGVIPGHYLFWLLGIASLGAFLINPTGFSNDQEPVLLALFAWSVFAWKTEKKAVTWFWWAGLIVSWMAFILGKIFEVPLIGTGLPVLYYCTWIGFLSLKEIRRIDQAPRLQAGQPAPD